MVCDTEKIALCNNQINVFGGKKFPNWNQYKDSLIVSLNCPLNSETTKSTKNTKKRICAMPDAAPAIPPKPRMAAATATKKNTIE